MAKLTNLTIAKGPGRGHSRRFGTALATIAMLAVGAAFPGSVGAQEFKVGYIMSLTGPARCSEKRRSKAQRPASRW